MLHCKDYKGVWEEVVILIIDEKSESSTYQTVSCQACHAFDNKNQIKTREIETIRNESENGRAIPNSNNSNNLRRKKVNVLLKKM